MIVHGLIGIGLSLSLLAFGMSITVFYGNMLAQMGMYGESKPAFRNLSVNSVKNSCSSKHLRPKWAWVG